MKKQGAKRRPWNKGLKVRQKGAFTPAQVKRIRQVLMARGVSGLRDLALFQVAIDTMLHGSTFQLTVNDVQLPNGKIRSVIKIARRGGMLPVRCAFSKTTASALGKWIAVSRKKRAVYLFPGRGTGSRRPMVVRHMNRLLKFWIAEAGLDPKKYGNEPYDGQRLSHFERHRRFGDRSDAPRSREDRINGEVSARAHNVRSNLYWSSLRHLTSARLLPLRANEPAHVHNSATLVRLPLPRTAADNTLADDLHHKVFRNCPLRP